MRKKELFDKGIFALLVISLLFSVITFSSVVIYAITREEPPPYRVDYSFEIQTNTTDSYTIYVPFIYNSDIVDELSFTKGEGEIVPITSSPPELFGNSSAIKVKSWGDIEIEGRTGCDEQPYLSLRVEKDSYYYWVYCEKTNPHQKISFSIYIDVLGPKYYIWSTTTYVTESGKYDALLDEGWNKINMGGANMYKIDNEMK